MKQCVHRYVRARLISNSWDENRIISTQSEMYCDDCQAEFGRQKSVFGIYTLVQERNREEIQA